MYWTQGRPWRTLAAPMQIESPAGGVAAAPASSAGTAAAHAEPDTAGKPRTIALPARLGPILSLDDFERAARRHLPAPIFAYISGAVERNDSLRANAASFAQYEFVPRMLVDISRRTTAATVLG